MSRDMWQSHLRWRAARGASISYILHLKNKYITQSCSFTSYIARDMLYEQNIGKLSSKKGNFRLLAVPVDFVVLSAATKFSGANSDCRLSVNTHLRMLKQAEPQYVLEFESRHPTQSRWTRDVHLYSYRFIPIRSLVYVLV